MATSSSIRIPPMPAKYTPTERKYSPAHRGISLRFRTGMKRKKPSKSSPSFANPEIQQIEQLLQFMTEHNLEEFDYWRGDLRIRLRKPSAGVVVSAPRIVAAPEIIIPASVEAPQASSGGAPAPEARPTED